MALSKKGPYYVELHIPGPITIKNNIMKPAIYLSGITGLILLMTGTIGIITGFTYHKLFLISGLVLLALIFLPLVMIHKYRSDKKIDRIIDSYKGGDKKTIRLEKGDSKTRGWSMNNSPFRERRSGLTWGGGNIKGAGASRGSRKSFLK